MPTSPAGLPGQILTTSGSSAVAVRGTKKHPSAITVEMIRFMMVFLRLPLRLKSIILQFDNGSEFQQSARDYLGSQSATVDESLRDAAQGELLQMAARFTQADAAQYNRADGERSADKMIERHT